MSVKENNTPPSAIVPSTITSNRTLTPSKKVVLTYLLEKYQCRDQQGNPWNFSNASITNGTGMKERNVYNITNALLKAKVLKYYGQITRKTRPTILYLFVPEALKAYLNTPEKGVLTLEKDIAKPAMPILDNANAAEANIEDTPKDRDNAKDIAKDIATIADHKEEYQKEEYQKKEE